MSIFGSPIDVQVLDKTSIPWSYTFNDCKSKYNNSENGYLNGDWNCDTNNNKCVLKCFKDEDCGKDAMCIHDKKLNYGKCVNEDYKKIMVGCLRKKYITHIGDYKSCYQFLEV